MSNFGDVAFAKVLAIRKRKQNEALRRNLWEEAIDSLGNEERPQIAFTRSTGQDVPLQLLDIVKAKKEECVRKQWKFTNSSGDKVMLRDYFVNIAQWLDKFRSIGDIAVQYDPGHAVLPWVAIRFFLQMTINDVQTYGAMMEGIEVVSKIVARYAEVEAFLLRGRSVLKSQLADAIVKLYSDVLRYLGKAKRYYSRTSTERFARSVLQTAKSGVISYLDRIVEEENEVLKLVALVRAQDQDKRLRSLQSAVQNLHVDSQTPKISHEEQRRKILTWLNATFTDDNYDNAQRLRQDGTCEWIFDRIEFKDWFLPAQSRSKILWIHGGPGFGKSVLCSKIIDQIKIEHTTSTAFFFCVAENEKKREPYGILKSWIAQLLQQNLSAVDALHDVFQGNDARSPTTSELWRMFRALAQKVKNTTLIVDGYDECTQLNTTSRIPTYDGQAQFLRDLILELTKTTASVIIISRENTDIRTEMTSEIITDSGLLVYDYGITQNDTQPDVSSFASFVVNQRLPKKKAQLKQELAEEASRKSAGMFLWVHLLRDELLPGSTPKELRAAVSEMPLGIEQTYAREIERLNAMRGKRRERAISILRWMVFAVRPMTVRELTEALALTTDDDEDSNIYPEDDLPETWTEGYVDEEYVNDNIRRPCGALVELRSRTDGEELSKHTLHFAHFSVKEFLLRPPEAGGDVTTSRLMLFPDLTTEHSKLAELCLRYLCYDVFGAVQDTEDDASLQQRVGVYPFLVYAARSWFAHASHHDPMTPDVVKYATKLFDPKLTNWKIWSEVYEANAALFDLVQDFGDDEPQETQDGNIDEDSDQTDDDTSVPEIDSNEGVADQSSPVVSPIYFAALLGLNDVIRALADQGLDVNAKGGFYGFPLLAAAACTQLETVKLLLEIGADASQCFGAFGCALNGAAANGSISIMNLLLDRGADTSGADKEGRTPLHYAAYDQPSEVVQLLITHGANVNSQTKIGSTPLLHAAINGNTSAASALLDGGADFNITNQDGWSPLLAAVSSDHSEVIKLLLEKGANVNVATSANRTTLHLAIQNRNDEIVQLLLVSGVEVDATNENGWTALGLCRTAKSMKALIDYGANVNHTNRDGWTPLHLAFEIGEADLIDLLIENGADLESNSKTGWPVVFSAVHDHGAESLRLAVQHGAKLDVHNQEGDTLLDYAISKGNQDAVNFLLEHGACFVERSPSEEDATTSTDLPSELSSTLPPAMAGNTLLLESLLTEIPEVNKPTILANALHAALVGQSRPTVEFLLGAGASVHSTSPNDRTPLHRAATIAKGEDLVKLLLDHGATLRARDSKGAEPLHRATQQGRRCGKTVELLIDRISKLPQRDSVGYDAEAETIAVGGGDLHTPEVAESPFKLQQRLAGMWKGTYTYLTYHAGDEEPTEIEIGFRDDDQQTSDTSSRFFSGTGSDIWGSYDIYGQSVAARERGCGMWYVKLYDRYGWLYEGEVKSEGKDGQVKIKGNWGMSRLLWHGTFEFGKVDGDSEEERGNDEGN